METRIQKTLLQWFPDAFINCKSDLINSDYKILQQFAKYTQKLITDDCENKKEPFKIIQLLYLKGTLYEKNAIENEFFNIIANQEYPITIKDHLNLMPEQIRAIFLKTILEN